MFVVSKTNGKWSSLALRFLIASVLMSVLLSLLDGVLHGPPRDQVSIDPFSRMLVYWVLDFRYIFEQGIYASTVFFVGAKFFESRTLLTVGFDTVDSSKVSVKGP